MPVNKNLIKFCVLACLGCSSIAFAQKAPPSTANPPPSAPPSPVITPLPVNTVLTPPSMTSPPTVVTTKPGTTPPPTTPPVTPPVAVVMPPGASTMLPVPTTPPALVGMTTNPMIPVVGVPTTMTPTTPPVTPLVTPPIAVVTPPGTSTAMPIPAAPTTSNLAPINPQVLPPAQASLISTTNPPSVNPKSQLNSSNPVSASQISQTQSNIQKQILNTSGNQNNNNLINNTPSTANQVVKNSPSIVNSLGPTTNKKGSSAPDAKSFLADFPNQSTLNTSFMASNNSTSSSPETQKSAVKTDRPNMPLDNAQSITTKKIDNDFQKPDLKIKPYSSSSNQYAFLTGSPTQRTMNYSFTKFSSAGNINSESGFLRASPLE